MEKRKPEEEVRKTKKGHEIFIIKEFCKSCRICIEFCPKGVLSLGEDLKVSVKDPEECIGCLLCEEMCPDFAISVNRGKADEKTSFRE